MSAAVALFLLVFGIYLVSDVARGVGRWLMRRVAA
jgi:hypothetical protein